MAKLVKNWQREDQHTLTPGENFAANAKISSPVISLKV